MYLLAIVSPLLIQLVLSSTPDVKQVEFVHVVFRHGDRTPDSSYPNDPYINEAYYPVGLGRLTNAGKRRAFKIGQNLRRRYGRIISDIYTPDILNAKSSHYPRCQASLQAVLAGLFPPRKMQLWNLLLQWQPIPYDAYRENNHMFTSMALCPKFGSYLGQYMKDTPIETLYPKYTADVDYILNSTGLGNHGHILGLVGAHSTIKSQTEWGLPLPKWAESVWPTQLTALAEQSWKNMFNTQQLRILNTGTILSDIMNNTYSRINQDNSFKNTTMFLYSGHDMTVAAILAAVGNLNLEYINYGSYIVFEVHNIKEHRFIKLHYENYNKEDPRVLKVPGCNELCPIEKFTKIIADYLDPVLYDTTCN